MSHHVGSGTNAGFIGWRKVVERPVTPSEGIKGVLGSLRGVRSAGRDQANGDAELVSWQIGASVTWILAGASQQPMCSQKRCLYVLLCTLRPPHA
eukprot:scaffold284629_cov36-Tisochrysis_lutea.AAC.2